MSPRPWSSPGAAGFNPNGPDLNDAWRFHPAEPALAQAFASRLQIHPVTAQLLINRGMRTETDAARFLSPALGGVTEGGGLPDAQRAVARIRAAIAEGETILIFGDCDVDGLTASVILYETLRTLGAHVQAVQSNKIADGYGFPKRLIEGFASRGVALVILVDCGTNQPDDIEQLAARGIDTIIVDHHVPLDRWAQPYALVNPFCRPGPFQELCSAGLALKLSQALWHAYGEPADRLEDHLDLAALGTLADCAPLRGESRAIVVGGLDRILSSGRPGLERLCEDTQTREAEPEQVTRRLVPRLNASGRLGDASAVWQALRRHPERAVDAWLAQIGAAHASTKQLQREVITEAREQVNRLHFKDQFVMLVSRTGWPQGLMGPLATQLSLQYGRPAIALALGERQGTGSGRSVPLFNLFEGLKACRDLLVRFGGHAQACGLTIDRKHVEAFRAALNDQARQALAGEGVGRTRWIDLELPLEAITPEWVEESQRLAPFGHGNPRPTVVVRNIVMEVCSPRTALLRQGAVSMAARGTLPVVEDGARYDVVVTPTLTGQEILLLVNDVKDAAAPSGRGRSSDKPCIPALA